MADIQLHCTDTAVNVQNESKLELADLVAFACLYLSDKQVFASVND